MGYMWKGECRPIEVLDVEGRLRPEFSREFQPRRFRRADADHPARSHLLRGGHGTVPADFDVYIKFMKMHLVK